MPRHAALYDEWQRSSARAKVRASLWVECFVATVCLLGAIALGTLTVTGELLVAIGVPIAGCLLLAALAWATHALYRYHLELADWLGVRELTFEERDVPPEQRDLDELLRLNRMQMQQYQTLSRAQHRSSFRSSLTALFVGLATLVGGIVLILEVNNETAKIALAGVTALGGALSGYIAKTYLALNSQAADQLRYFADQPLITSYIYEAERLVLGFKGYKREAMYEKVIDEVLGVATRAQSGALATAGADSPETSEQGDAPGRPDSRRRRWWSRRS
jgi:hypothetical protein